ncbi:MAG: hypothetical protein CVV00_03520 [Firmicutes bacterium HGW-Firmicutes-5]|nr:MAG: hypothetical protein CVV00_03520 [Firmicutes bacterium HGW-Firmicutes-5]
MIKSIKHSATIILIAFMFIGCEKTTDTLVVDALKQQEIDAFHEKANNFLSKRNFNGSILVAKDGFVYLAEGYGLLDENFESPNERGTIYPIGSLTKSFTSMAIMQLQEDNKLNVHDPIEKFFPNYPNDAKITIHHLLTHTSGINPNPIDFTEFNELLNENNGIMDKNIINKIVEIAANQPLLFEPGTQHDYSNNGYLLLGAIIEEVSGRPYGAYIEEYICKPLNMNNTGYNDSNVPLTGQAIGFTKGYTTNVSPSMAYAGGGMHSTIDDLFKWSQGIKDHKLVSKKTTIAMLTPFMDAYSYGWYIYADKFMHRGKINGYRSFFVTDTKKDYTLIILSNYPSTAEVSRIVDVLTSYINELK